MNAKIISIFVLAALVVLFIVQNAAIVEIKFLFWSIQISSLLFMFLLLAIGIVIGLLLYSHFKSNVGNK